MLGTVEVPPFFTEKIPKTEMHKKIAALEMDLD